MISAPHSHAPASADSLPHQAQEPKAGRTTWSERLRQQIPLFYEARQLTVKEIADLLNVTPRTVRTHASVPATEARQHDAIVLDARGWVRSAIADALGLSDRTVGRYLAQREEQAA